ncbi:MAG: hypothetical protein EBW65_10420, partial [Gammaproteobacteria bacterium]|nr:hypothetical protein [Gammaproteobacteria bacterium]
AGVVLRPENQDLLQAHQQHVIWLQADLKTQFDRLKNALRYAPAHCAHRLFGRGAVMTGRRADFRPNCQHRGLE